MVKFGIRYEEDGVTYTSTDSWKEGEDARRLAEALQMAEKKAEKKARRLANTLQKAEKKAVQKAEKEAVQKAEKEALQKAEKEALRKAGAINKKREPRNDVLMAAIMFTWHPTKNGVLDPRFVLSTESVWWLCVDKKNCLGTCTHIHEWRATITSRFRNGKVTIGCPWCASRGRGVKVCPCKSLQELKPDLALQWHPTKNGTLLPKDVGIYSGKVVWWICTSRPNTTQCVEECYHFHEWPSIISNRTSGSGCPWCSGMGNVVCPCQSLQSREPALALEWHETKNGPLLPTQVTVYCNKKVWWRCALGHEWDAYVSNRTAYIQGRTGCPTCNFNKGEVQLKEILSTHALVESYDKRTIRCYDNVLAKWRNLIPDAMGTLTNGIVFMVEIDGAQHFHIDDFYNKGEAACLRNQICRDFAKNQYAADHGISSLRIAYTEFDQIGN